MLQIRFKDTTGIISIGEFSGNSILLEDREYSLNEIDVLPPTQPSKIVCVGLNYADHAAETAREPPSRPSLFLKPPNTLAGHEEIISLLPNIKRIDFEAELGVIIGKRCRNVSLNKAMDVVAGYTCVNDLSNRDDQRKEQNWVRGKAFDKSAPMGPVMASPDSLPEDARIILRSNGITKQDSSVDDMIFSVPELIAEITRYMTLETGDVISTGTPAGVGPIEDQDVVEVEIQGIGKLTNKFIKKK